MNNELDLLAHPECLKNILEAQVFNWMLKYPVVRHLGVESAMASVNSWGTNSSLSKNACNFIQIEIVGGQILVTCFCVF